MNDFLLDILQLQIVQIVLVAYIGALLGEMKEEVDDEVVLSKFVITWMCSGFGGVMVGLLLQGTVAKNNNYVVLGGSGIAGFAGQQKSVGFATRLLTSLVGNGSESKEIEKEITPRKRKRREKHK